MSTTFHQFNNEQMETVLDLYFEYAEVDHPNTQEITYEIPLPDDDYSIRVLTSIDPDVGIARKMIVTLFGFLSGRKNTKSQFQSRNVLIESRQNPEKFDGKRI